MVPAGNKAKRFRQSTIPQKQFIIIINFIRWIFKSTPEHSEKQFRSNNFLSCICRIPLFLDIFQFSKPFPTLSFSFFLFFLCDDWSKDFDWLKKQSLLFTKRWGHVHTTWEWNKRKNITPEILLNTKQVLPCRSLWKSLWRLC